MKVDIGNGTTEFGPGVSIELSGVEVATAILAYLVAQGVHINGPRTLRVNGELIESGGVSVDPTGSVQRFNACYSGRGGITGRIPEPADPPEDASVVMLSQEVFDALEMHPFSISPNTVTGERWKFSRREYRELVWYMGEYGIAYDAGGSEHIRVFWRRIEIRGSAGGESTPKVRMGGEGPYGEQ